MTSINIVRTTIATTLLIAIAGTNASADDAPTASAKNIVGSAVTIFRDPARYTSFPDVKQLPDGQLLCVFRDAPFPDRVTHIEVGARAVGTISDDHGQSWSTPFVIYQTTECTNDPSVCVLRDGRLLMNFFMWQGLSESYVKRHKPPFARRVGHGDWGDYAQPNGIRVLSSDGDPRRWQPSARHISGSPQILRATSSSILETDKGTLLLATYGRSLDRKTDQAYVHRSDDGGRSWNDEQLIAVDPNGKIAMQEPALIQAGNGDIVAILRTAKASDHLYTVRSSDDGQTWSTPTDTGLIGHPADMVLLPDGRLFVTYGHRHKPFGVRACISDDNGMTWDRSKEIVIADNGDHYDLGYPSVCLTGDGYVIIAYYLNGPDTKQRWIECKRIALADL